MSQDGTLGIRTQLKTDLKAAMKARQSNTVSALRSLLAAIDNAEAVDIAQLPQTSLNIDASPYSPDVPRKILTEADLRRIIGNEIDEASHALAEYNRLGRAEDAARMGEILAALQGYAPTIQGDEDGVKPEG